MNFKLFSIANANDSSVHVNAFGKLFFALLGGIYLHSLDKLDLLSAPTIKLKFELKV